MQQLMIVVLDTHYESSIQKLCQAGFQETVPRRGPDADILETLPDPDKLLKKLKARYAKLDSATTTFDYPEHYRTRMQLVLMPASYTHLSISALAPVATTTLLAGQYDVYHNLYYPLERVLLESFIRVILEDRDGTLMSHWGKTIKMWIGMMVGYLEVDNDAVDDCPDEAVREWFNEYFGRKREAKYGPWDRRVSKRLGSGREMPYDMRGHPVAPTKLERIKG
jgi:hypothetical protein